MSEWLARPKLTDDREQDLRTPNLEIDRPSDGALSPFANTYEQYRLAHILVAEFGSLAVTDQEGRASCADAAVMRWASELPAELRLQQADISHDAAYPWIPTQRAQLHCFVQMTRFTPLKSFLIRPLQGKGSTTLSSIQKSAVTVALSCMGSALDLVKTIKPNRTRYHFVAFVLFDTAATICSALIHDRERTLAPRDDLLRAIVLAIDALDKYRMLNDSMRGACTLLKRLTSKLPLSSEEADKLQHFLHDRVNGEGASQNLMESPSHELSQTCTKSGSVMTTPSMEGNRAPMSDQALDSHNESEQPLDPTVDGEVDWEALLNVDLGPISEIWDPSQLDLIE